MKLALWLVANDVDDPAFAKAMGVDRSTVSKWRNGRTTPDGPNQRKIYRLTGGSVSPNDFMPNEDRALQSFIAIQDELLV